MLLEGCVSRMREKQKKNHDKRHKAQGLKPLNPGDSVWVPGMQVDGKVEMEISPKTYKVSAPCGPLRRNCQHLQPIPNSPTSIDDNHYEDIPEFSSSSSTEYPSVTTTPSTTEILNKLNWRVPNSQWAYVGFA